MQKKDVGNVLGANPLGDESAIRLLDIIDLGGESVVRGTPVIQYEGAGADRLGDVPNAFRSVCIEVTTVPREWLCNRTRSGSLPCGMHHSAGTPPASTSA
jgi:hypothetical protein